MTHEERASKLVEEWRSRPVKFDSSLELVNSIAAALREVERETWTGLKVTNDQLRWALKELGPTGTNAEAYIKAAVEYLIDVRAKAKP